MASKSTNSKYKNNSSKSKSKKNKKGGNNIPKSRKISFLFGIVSLVLALFLFVAFTSFIFSGAEDCQRFGNTPDYLNSAALSGLVSSFSACSAYLLEIHHSPTITGVYFCAFAIALRWKLTNV